MVHISAKIVFLLLCFLGLGNLSVFAQTNCSVSQATLDSDQRYLKVAADTHFTLMGVRYTDLRRAKRGLECSGIPLVAFSGLRYESVGFTDDPGIYLFVPALAHFARLTVAGAADAFLVGVVLLTSGLGLLGFLLTASTGWGRFVGTAAFVLLSLVELRAGDVYALGAAPAVACIPWIMFFVSRKRLTAGMLVTVALVGVAAEMASFLRSEAGLGVLLFSLVIILFVYPLKRRQRVVLAITLFLGAGSVSLLFRHLYARRDAFLRQQPQAMIERSHGHVFWHNLYIGLGYVKNPEIPGYLDGVAAAKVQELRPGTEYCSPEYEQVLKGEVMRLVRQRPLLLTENLLMKIFVVSGLCLCSMNIGLFAAIFVPKPRWTEIAFWLAIAFGALPGILVLPIYRYSLTAIVCGAIYAAYSIDYAARNPHLRERLNWLRQRVFAHSVESA